MAKVKNDRTLEAFFESFDEISFDEADEAFSELKVDIGREMVAFIRRRPELFVGMGCYSWVARKPTISSRVLRRGLNCPGRWD